jgi:ABC-2 type transport system permease protein
MTEAGAELRAFAATALKEWRILRRYPADLAAPAVWALLLPAAYVAMAKGFQGGDAQTLAEFGSRAGTTEIPAFLYLGWAVQVWLTMVLWGPGLSIRRERVRGSLESVLLTRTSRLTLLFGGGPAYLLWSLVMFAASVGALRLFFNTPIGPADLARALFVILASTPILLSMAALFATLALRFQDSDGVIEIIRALCLLLCGVSYPLSVLPGWVQALGHGLPPTAVIAALRAAMLEPVGLADLARQLLWLLLGAAVIGVVAWYALGRALAAARRTGKLGQF